MMSNKKKKKSEPEKIKDSSSNQSTPSPIKEQKPIKFQNNNNNIIGGIDIQYLRKFYQDKDFIKKLACLLPCENIENYEKSSYNNNQSISNLGILILTKFRLQFIFQDQKMNDNIALNELSIPLFSINKIDKVLENKDGSYEIDIHTIDTKVRKFFIWAKDLKFFGDINEYAFPHEQKVNFQYPIDYCKYIKSKDKFIDGWNLYNIKNEFIRQGINEQEGKFRFSEANKNYDICSTYPNLLVVPKNTNDKELSGFNRLLRRFPVLTYYYNNKSGFGSLFRSSQIDSEINSIGNNALINDIISLNGKMHIFIVNKLKNNNENNENFFNVEKTFCDIEDYKFIQSSFKKIFEISQNSKIKTDQKFYSKLENTNWYLNIHLLLKYANEIKDKLIDNETILIHGKEGLDRTTQLISLTQLLIEPYYRTIKGFAILIEKDWISFGHPFGFRNGVFINKNDDEKSPVFLQFLDCVHQLMYQFPNSFEFNHKFLLYLANYSILNLYGTFLFNCDKERKDNDAYNKTLSIWSDLFMDLNKYKNLYYEHENICSKLNPNYSFSSLHFWDDYFCQNCRYIENRNFYLNQDEKIMFNSPLEFFDYIKEEEVKKEEKQNIDMKMIKDLLFDIYLKSKDNTEVFNSFEDDTKRQINFLGAREEDARKQLNNKFQNLFGTSRK